MRPGYSLFILCCLLLLWSGCSRSDGSPSDHHESPATVEAHPDENTIFLVTLSEHAVERLGITTAAVRTERVERQRTFGGEVLAPVGNVITVSAPLPGTLGPLSEGAIPQPGTSVTAGQPVFSFVPMLSPERDVPTPAERVQMANAYASLASAQIIAEGDVRQAQAEVEAAQIVLDRAEQLLEDMVGTERAVDDARATHTIAERKLEAATTRADVLNSLTLEAQEGELRTFDITSPADGILRNLSATRGQMVTTGMPLFEVVNLDTVWVRVPVYVGQLADINEAATVSVGKLGADRAVETRVATPIAAPPTANALASTVDLYFELDNTDGGLHPGERVGVTVPLAEEADRLVVPWAAILHDHHGTEWVYEQTEERVFRRRRVLVDYTTSGADGELAVLASELPEGMLVVVDGTAELFGTEFGVGH